jgi:hypothetical protein
MYQSINQFSFRDAFHNMGRGEQFSYEGLTILFEGLEQYEEGADEKMELDVIALCCDFSELTAEEIQRQYSVEHDIEDESSLTEQVEDFLACNTWVLGSHEIDGVKHYIFQQF